MTDAIPVIPELEEAVQQQNRPKAAIFWGASSHYPVVNKHSWLENPPFSIGNTSSKGPFSIAMLVYQRVVFRGVYPPKINMEPENEEVSSRNLVSFQGWFHPFYNSALWR